MVIAVARYVQPSLFGNLAFLSRKRKIVKITKGTKVRTLPSGTSGSYRTGRARGIAAPFAIDMFGQRAARGKIARKRKAG